MEDSIGTENATKRKLESTTVAATGKPESNTEHIEHWMKISLGYAEAALKRGEVPVGCLFLFNNEIIANGSNTVNETKNATKHAEMNCIDTVLKWCEVQSRDFRQVFSEVEVIVTVEPCIMCASALHQLGVKQIVYGCANSRFGGCCSVVDASLIYKESSCAVFGGVFAEEAILLLKEFYKGTNPNAPASKVKKKKKT